MGHTIFLALFSRLQTALLFSVYHCPILMTIISWSSKNEQLVTWSTTLICMDDSFLLSQEVANLMHAREHCWDRLLNSSTNSCSLRSKSCWLVLSWRQKTTMMLNIKFKQGWKYYWTSSIDKSDKHLHLMAINAYLSLFLFLYTILM